MANIDSYICEISPPSRRGPLTAGPQLFNTFGLVVGFFTCYGSANLDSSFAWRTPFIMLACLSMIFVVASGYWLVPSPRWLILRGRRSEAFAVWDFLGVHHTERERDELELQANTVESRSSVPAIDVLGEGATSTLQVPGSTAAHGFFDMFARDVRSQTGMAVFLLAMQQLSGIDGVLYVSTYGFALYSAQPAILEISLKPC